MSKLGIFAFVVLGLVVVASDPVAANPAHGSMYVRGGFQYAGQSLDEVGDYVDALEADLVDVGLPPTYGNFDGSLGFETEAGWQFYKTVSFGIGVAYNGYSKDNASAGVVAFEDREISLSTSQAMDATITEITANCTYWVPGAAGLFVGAQAGVGFGNFEELQLFTATSGSLYSFSSALQRYSGTGFVGGVFAGYRLDLAPTLSLYARTGYRFRNLGELEGSYDPPMADEPAKHELMYQDANGDVRSVTFDFSDLFASIGVGVSFGGRSH